MYFSVSGAMKVVLAQIKIYLQLDSTKGSIVVLSIIIYELIIIISILGVIYNTCIIIIIDNYLYIITRVCTCEAFLAPPTLRNHDNRLNQMCACRFA